VADSPDGQKDGRCEADGDVNDTHDSLAFSSFCFCFILFFYLSLRHLQWLSKARRADLAAMMDGMVEGLREKERMQLCLVDIKILSASYMSGILPIGRAEITRNYSSSGSCSMFTTTVIIF
jgi:hypothetical protein